MSESDIITALLNSNADDKPTMIVPLKRLGIPVTLKALLVNRFLEFVNVIPVQLRKEIKQKRF